MTPATGQITRPIKCMTQTAALLKPLLDGYMVMIQERNDAGSPLDKSRALITLPRRGARLRGCRGDFL